MATETERYNTALARALEEVRASQGVSQRELERRTDNNRGSISKAFSGKHGPTISTLRSLCTGLETDMFATMPAQSS